MSASGSTFSGEALRSVRLPEPLPEPQPLARPPPEEVVPDPVPHLRVGCGQTAPCPLHLEQAAAAGRPVPAANGRCIQCTALEDLRVACLTLDRKSPEARHIVENCWSLRRLAGSVLFDQAIEGGPARSPSTSTPRLAAHRRTKCWLKLSHEARQGDSEVAELVAARSFESECAWRRHGRGVGPAG